MSAFKDKCAIVGVLPDDLFSYGDDRRALTCCAMDGIEIQGEDDGAFFIRLQSWHEERLHPLLESLRGKRVRITIAVEDDA